MSKTPKLRFKEFSGDWEEKKLGEISNIYDGTHQTPKYTEKGIKFVSVENIGNIYEGNKYISEEDYNRNFKIKPQLNDIFMTRITAGEIGATAIVDREEELAYYVSVALIRSDNEKLNSLFLTKYIASKYFKRELNKRIIHVAFPKKINLGDIGDCGIKLPKLEEQEKIASFFSLIDDKISLQGEKLKMLKDYKKGMMQKIFSRDLRFKDDEGRDYPEWEEKKLGECISNKGGTALEKFVDENGTHKFISIGNYSTDGKYIDSGQRISLNDKTKDKLLQKNDLVMILNDKTSTGDLIGSTILIDEDNKYIYNQRSERLICNENIYCNFAWILLNSKTFRKKVFSIAQGGTQIYVNFSNVKELSIELPSLKEQRKISKFILNLDKKIEKEQEKLDSLNEYKKGLLQQMFI